MAVLDKIGDGLWFAVQMAWEVWWALVLGFLLSGIVQAWVPRSRMERALGGRGLRSVTLATGLGAASSSCSYAATAIARSMFEKGASFATAMVFQFASTNLVFEIGIVLWIFIGWQFTLAEFVGGIFLIAMMWLGVRLFITRKLEADARVARAGRGRRPPARVGRLGEIVARAAHLPRRVVGRGAQLPRRLADALEGDQRRLPHRRVHRAAADVVLQRPLRHRRVGAGQAASRT